MNIPPGLCRVRASLLLGYSGRFFCLDVYGCFFSGVGMLSVVSPFSALQAPTRVWITICVPSSSLFVWYVRRRRFSVFFFFVLSGAGETQALMVWVSPCVSSSWLRTTSSTRTSSPSPTPGGLPSPCFFFRRSRGLFLVFSSPPCPRCLVVDLQGLHRLICALHVGV